MRNLILGTDWWYDCDDVVALRILARAHKKGEICLKGVAVNTCMEYTAASVDGLLSSEGVSDVPIGVDFSGTDFGGVNPYQKNLACHAKRVMSNSDAEDSVRLYRRLLAESDGKVELLEIGFLTVEQALLNSAADDISPKSGLELYKEKVSKVWVMAGKWDEPLGKEYNFANTPRACRAAAEFCEKCPVPVTFLGFEVGVDVISGGELPKDDVLYRALCDFGASEGRSSWDPMLACLALCGDERAAGYDFVCGKASVNPQTGENTFEKCDGGTHRYVIKQHENEYYRHMINELIK